MLNSQIIHLVQSKYECNAWYHRIVNLSKLNNWIIVILPKIDNQIDPLWFKYYLLGAGHQCSSEHLHCILQFDNQVLISVGFMTINELYEGTNLLI